MSISVNRLWRAAAILTVPAVAAATIGARPSAPVRRADDQRPAVSAPVRAAMSPVIVQARGAGMAAGAAVAQAGGQVTHDLPVVNGVAATVPTGNLPALAARPGLIVTADSAMTVQGAVSPSATTTSAYRKVVGADDLNADGYKGAGVTVALIDTGVAAVPDLAGKVLPIANPLGGTKPCVNLSGESDCADRYGHGTFMAGIIAGSGASSGGIHKGMAPTPGSCR